MIAALLARLTANCPGIVVELATSNAPIERESYPVITLVPAKENPGVNEIIGGIRQSIRMQFQILYTCDGAVQLASAQAAAETALLGFWPVTAREPLHRGDAEPVQIQGNLIQFSELWLTSRLVQSAITRE